MSADARVLVEAAGLVEAGERFVLVTVASVKGSAPRDPGAKMIWRESGEIIGTIGGGELEELARESARNHLEAGTSGVESFNLGVDADQCCGGVVELLFEPHAPGVTLVVFGAGHVSRELARLMAPAPVSVVVVDDRAEWNAPERFPDARRVLNFDDGVRLALANPSTTMACVMSCSHDMDFQVLRKILASPPEFVGLIGSKSKRASFFTRLAAAGLPPESIERVRCPIGLGDMGKAPGLVAVSIAGELLLEAMRIGEAG